MECCDGREEWYKNGKLHREGGPAAEYPREHKIWYKNGKKYREDGPACIYSSSAKLWFLNDRRYGKNNDFTNESWIRFVKTLIFS